MMSSYVSLAQNNSKMACDHLAIYLAVRAVGRVIYFQSTARSIIADSAVDSNAGTGQ